MSSLHLPILFEINIGLDTTNITDFPRVCQGYTGQYWDLRIIRKHPLLFMNNMGKCVSMEARHFPFLPFPPV